MLFLPESPVWYCRKGRHEDAIKSLRRLNGHLADYDEEHEYAVFRQEVEESQALAAKSSNYSWIACFKGTNLRRTLVSTIPFSMQVGGPCGALSLISHPELCRWTPHVQRSILFADDRHDQCL